MTEAIGGHRLNLGYLAPATETIWDQIRFEKCSLVDKQMIGEHWLPNGQIIL